VDNSTAYLISRGSGGNTEEVLGVFFTLLSLVSATRGLSHGYCGARCVTCLKKSEECSCTAIGNFRQKVARN
jgi:hypothetical protein